MGKNNHHLFSPVILVLQVLFNFLFLKRQTSKAAVSANELNERTFQMKSSGVQTEKGAWKHINSLLVVLALISPTYLFSADECAPSDQTSVMSAANTVDTYTVSMAKFEAISYYIDVTTGGTVTITTNNGNNKIHLNGSGTTCPTATSSGTTSITYTSTAAFDVNVVVYASNAETHTLTINFVPTPNNDPVAHDKSYNTLFETAVSGNVMTDAPVDSDPDGDPITVSANTTPADGNLTLNSDGSFTYTPDNNFSGTDSFTYTISDGNGGTDTATITITVNPAGNSDPVANDKTYTTDFETSVSGNIITDVPADSDLDGDTLSIDAFTYPTDGNLTLNSDGSFTYTPDNGLSGTDSFTYTITDGNGGTATATVRIYIGEETGTLPPYQNEFSCGIFPSVLTSYKSISALQNDVYNACTVSVKGQTITESTQHHVLCWEEPENDPDQAACICDPSAQICSLGSSTLSDGRIEGACALIPEPVNRFSHDFIESAFIDVDVLSAGDLTLTNLDNPGYTIDKSGNDATIVFNPSETYPDNTSRHLILTGDMTNSGGLDITLYEADYYFESWTMDGLNTVVNILGETRIYIRDDFTVLKSVTFDFVNADSSLFIYVGGDMIFEGNGGGNNDPRMFFYVEGDATINTNAETSRLLGGITAEGAIDIQGNNADFEYDSEGAAAIGFGDCVLCWGSREDDGFVYNESDINTNNGDMFVPLFNISPVPLDDLVISESYDENLSFAYTGSYAAQYFTSNPDTYSPYPGSSTQTVSPWAHGLDAAIIPVTLDNTAIEYTFGDNFGVTGFPADDYPGMSKSAQLLDFNSTVWFDNVYYIADYIDDQNRSYHVKVSACDTPSGGAGNEFINWNLDAVDTCNALDFTCYDTKIKTKVAGRTYNLTILDVNTSGGSAALNTTGDRGIGIGLVDVTNDQVYFLGEVAINDGVGAAHMEAPAITFPFDVATQNAYIQFYYCNNDQDWNTCYVSPSIGAGEVPRKIIGRDDQNESSSWDRFSIRPENYTIAITAPDLTRLSSGTFYNMDVTASYEGNTSGTIGYDQTLGNTADNNASLVPNFGALSCPNTANVTFTLPFTNGTATLPNAVYTTGLSYNDVGDIDITLLDRNWTAIDNATVPVGCVTGSNDTSTDPVGCEISAIQAVRFVPSDFNITASLANEGTNYTYLSDFNASGVDSNESARQMGATLDINITARNAIGNVTTNYSVGCYAKDINISIGYDTLTLTPAPVALTKAYGFETNSETLGSGALNAPIVLENIVGGQFISGIADLDIKLNFDRRVNGVVNPFDFHISPSDINISNSDGVWGINTPDIGSADFFYGRVHAPRYRVKCNPGTPTGGCNTSTTPLTQYFEVYCQGAGCDTTRLSIVSPSLTRSVDALRWYRNTIHTQTNEGNITSTAQRSGALAQEYGTYTDAPGQTTTPYTYNGSQGYPYKTTIEVNASNWLIYNKYDTNAVRNAYELEFNAKGVFWGGTDQSGNRIDNNATENTNRRIMW